MIESLFKQRSTLARLQSGPLAQELPFIAEALHHEQYPPETVRRYVRVADGFGRWLCKHGLRVTEADEATLARYRASTGRRKKGQLRAAGRGLRKVLALLRKQHAVGEPARVADTEGDTLVAAFDSHLQHVAGLMPGTRSQYLRYAALFVKAVFGTASFDITKVTPQTITDFVRARAVKLKPSACAAPATGMRVFLRFLVTCRGLPAAVIGAVPTNSAMEAGIAAQAFVCGRSGSDAGNLRREVAGWQTRSRYFAPAPPARVAGGRSRPSSPFRCRLERGGAANLFAEIRARTKAALAQ